MDLHVFFALKLREKDVVFIGGMRGVIKLLFDAFCRRTLETFG